MKKSNFPDFQHTKVLYNAFAHNDYAHGRPLFDALEKGFNFIEADIHLIKGNLFVSHNRPFWPDKKKTLSALYLDPLFQIFQENRQRIFPNSNRPLQLMIDIKTDGVSTYNILKKVLLPYQEMLCSWENNVKQDGAINVIISGNRPINLVKNAPNRFVQIDGRIEDLAQNYPSELMPMISDNFAKIFGRSWFFRKSIHPEGLKKLSEIAKITHQQNKTLRLWSCPEDESTWDNLLNAGVNYINTDHLDRLKNYFERKA